MNLDEAAEVIEDLAAYYGRKLPSTAKKIWVKAIVTYDYQSAQRALEYQFDSANTFPRRGEFRLLVRNCERQLFPRRYYNDEPREAWEIELAQAVYPFWTRYLAGQDSVNDWANNFRAIAQHQGVADRIDWSAWEQIEGVKLYV